MSEIPHAETGENSSDSAIRRLLSEPLLHFIVLGGLLFGVYAFRNSDATSGTEQLVVSSGKIEHLAGLFAKTWQRPPTEAELKGLIDDYVREEVAYREGMSMGLDRDDTIIRRRIRQKLDFVAQDLLDLVEPTEEQLAAFLQKHPEKFQADARLTFRQVYFSIEEHSDDLDNRIKDLVAKLQSDRSIDASQQGDRILLEFLQENISAREIQSMFGKAFSDQLVTLELGKWHGPIQSAYGLHAVIVDSREGGTTPPLELVSDAVRREWEHEQRLKLREEFYEKLLEKYDVTLQFPGAQSSEAGT